MRVQPTAFEMNLEHFEYYLTHPDKQRWNSNVEMRKKSVKVSKPKESMDEEQDTVERSDDASVITGARIRS